MNHRPRRIYVVHDERGRILGIAPIAMEQVNERVRLDHRPVPAADQKVTKIELTDEHAGLAPHELLALEVATDPQAGRPHLRRRANPISKR